MRKIALVAVILFMTISCSKDSNYTWMDDFFLMVPVMAYSHADSFSSNTIDFTLDILMCSDYSVFPPDTNALHLYNGPNYRYAITGSTLVNPEKQDEYCMTLLVDQSGDYLDEDFNNERSLAFNEYYRHISTDGSFILSAFSAGGLLPRDTCTVFWEGFTNAYNDANARDLLELASLTGGQSCLLDALYNMTDYMAQNGTGTNRSIVAFVHKKDEVSRHTVSEVIDHAILNNVRINIIWLKDSALDVTQLTKIPVKTGGFSIYCYDELNLIPLFHHLAELLRNEAAVRRYSVKFLAQDMAIGPGFQIIHVAGITDYQLPCYFSLEL
jgi:hypothetical protein